MKLFEKIRRGYEDERSTCRIVGQHGWAVTAPFWAPDGARLGFSDGGDVYVINTDGTGSTAIESSATFCIGSSWHPNGSRILMFCRDSGADSTTYSVSPDGSDRVALGTGEWPDWSPDGTRIAFSLYAGGANEAWVMRSDGTNRTRVATSDADVVRWAPDGLGLATAAFSPAGVRTMNADGTNVVSVPNTAYAEFVTWQVAPGTAPTTTAPGGASSTSSSSPSSTSTSMPASSSTTGVAATTTSTSAPDAPTTVLAPLSTAGGGSPGALDQTPPGGPLTATPGQVIVVDGTGFLPASPGEVLFASTPRKVGTFVADGSGRVRSSLAVPTDVSTGLHHVLLSGVGAAGEARTVSIGVQVTASAGELAHTGSDQTSALMVAAAALATVLLARCRSGLLLRRDVDRGGRVATLKLCKQCQAGGRDRAPRLTGATWSS